MVSAYFGTPNGSLSAGAAGLAAGAEGVANGSASAAGAGRAAGAAAPPAANGSAAAAGRGDAPGKPAAGAPAAGCVLPGVRLRKSPPLERGPASVMTFSSA